MNETISDKPSSDKSIGSLKNSFSDSEEPTIREVNQKHSSLQIENQEIAVTIDQEIKRLESQSAGRMGLNNLKIKEIEEQLLDANQMLLTINSQISTVFNTKTQEKDKAKDDYESKARKI